MRITSLKKLFEIFRYNIEHGELSFRLDGGTGRTLLVNVTNSVPVKNTYIVTAQILDQRRCAVMEELPILFFSASAKIFVPDENGVQSYVSGWNVLTESESQALAIEANAIYSSVSETQMFMLEKMENSIRAYMNMCQNTAGDACSGVAVHQKLTYHYKSRYASVSPAERLALSIYTDSADERVLRILTLSLMELRNRQPDILEKVLSDVLSNLLCSNALAMGIDAGSYNSFSDFTPLEVMHFLEDPAFFEISDASVGNLCFDAIMSAYRSVTDALLWFHNHDGGSNLYALRALMSALRNLPQSGTAEVYINNSAKASVQSIKVKVSQLVSLGKQTRFCQQVQKTKAGDIWGTSGMPVWGSLPGRDLVRPEAYHLMIEYKIYVRSENLNIALSNIAKIEYRGAVIFDSAFFQN